MILGMSTAAFTLLHVVISLVGIVSGAIVVGGMLKSNRLPGWTALFLTTTVLTSATGFLFHSKAFGPPHVIGLLSLILMLFAILGYYAFRLAGAWRGVYVVTALLSLWFNAFVGIIQAFQKIPALNALAPTQSSEPAFVVAQLLVLALFIWAGLVALRRFKFSTVAMAVR